MTEYDGRSDVADGGSYAPADDVPAASEPMRDQSVVEAVRAELDDVLPHVVAALKANDALHEIVRRLDRAEKRLAEREQRPLVGGILRVLHQVRRLDLPPDARELLLAELEGLVVGAGYQEFGEAGEPFDPSRHEALQGQAADGRAVVSEVYELGLETLGEVVIPARVAVEPSKEEENPE